MPLATPSLHSIADIEEFLGARADLHALLVHVERLGLPDAWIGAGLIRNAVWDALHGHAAGPLLLNDVDVVFFDPADACETRDIALQGQLEALIPGIPWQIRNQARMHRRNGDAAYRDTCDAIAHWPETATAVAARTVRGRVEVIAPHGIDDLVAMIVRPTPAFGRKMQDYRERLASKDWAARWPRLRFL